MRLFGELCYEVFYKFEPGVKLLSMLENRFFRSPVAYPNKEPSWAYFNEGKNELIRSFTAGMQTHLALTTAREKAQKALSEAAPMKGRARKPTIRPIR